VKRYGFPTRLSDKDTACSSSVSHSSGFLAGGPGNSGDPLPGQAPGREGLKAFLATVLFPAFPDQRWVPDEQISEGDKVVSRFTMFGTHRGDFMGIPATGKSVAVKGVVIDHVVDGKWKDSRILMDNLILLQQLGAIPPAPPTNNATQRHHS
jgi:predicted ester cyclase